MKVFKRIIISLLAGIMLFSATPVFAQYGLQQTAQKTPYNTKIDFFAIIEKVVAGVLATLSIVFFGLALYAGVRWMTARGDEGHIEKAKDTLRAAVIGLIIVLAALAITRFVFTQINSSSGSPPASS